MEAEGPLAQTLTTGDFLRWLRREIRDRRLSQRMVAMRAGVNHSTLSRWLSEGHEPSLPTLSAVVVALGGTVHIELPQ